MSHTYSNKDGEWAVEDLWAAAAGQPVEFVAVDELWARCSSSSIQRAWSPKTLLWEVKRTLASDLSFPLILTPGGMIADGHHRLVKAKLEGVKELPTIKLVTMP